MYLTRNELLQKGFNYLGKNVQISDKASIYGAENIRIGDNVRIDDFCILSGNIIIGNYVHIACHSVLIGKGIIYLNDYSGVSIRCTILSSNADYGGYYLTNPNVPQEFTNPIHKAVVLGKHSLLGAGCVVLPGVTLQDGAIAGAMSLVKKDIPSYQIWGGNPIRFIKNRKEINSWVE